MPAIQTTNYKIQNQPDPQAVQAALNACDSAHTGIHRAIAEIKQGSVIEGKRLISQQIAALANALLYL